MSHPIVVGTDGSTSAEHAVQWAATEAARRRRGLHIVYAVTRHDVGLAPYPGCWRAGLLTDVADRVLTRSRELAAKVADDLRVTTEQVFEAPGHALREQAGHAAEVVVGHRGLGGVAGLLLGSTSLFLAGRTPCPLVVVRGGAGEGRNEVLVGVDLREDSAEVLAYAFETAALRGAWLRAVHAWEAPEPLAGARPEAVREALADAQERLAEAMVPGRTRYPALRIVEETPYGRPVEELVRRSGRADLLVVGPHRRDGWPHIGSVARGVIHYAGCPVAVLGPRPDGPSRPRG